MTNRMRRLSAGLLLFTSLWLLVRSFRYAADTRPYTAYVILFYLAVYGVIATNSLFASSYIWSLGVALVLSYLAGLLGPRLATASAATRRRLLYVPLFCAVLAFLFNGYIYPPAGTSLAQVPDLFDRVTSSPTLSCADEIVCGIRATACR